MNNKYLSSFNFTYLPWFLGWLLRGRRGIPGEQRDRGHRRHLHGRRRRHPRRRPRFFGKGRSLMTSLALLDRGSKSCPI